MGRGERKACILVSNGVYILSLSYHGTYILVLVSFFFLILLFCLVHKVLTSRFRLRFTDLLRTGILFCKSVAFFFQGRQSCVIYTVRLLVHISPSFFASSTFE